MDEDGIVEKVRPLLEEFFREKSRHWQEKFTPGRDKVPVGYPLYDEQEVIGVLKALLELRLSLGPFVKQFERDYAEYKGTRFATAVNSGTSANIVAINTLKEAGILKEGQEVIIPAATFSAVASPILQNGLIPVYVDVEEDSYDISPEEVEKAISENTGLIMPVHSLGSPADMKKIMEVAEQHGLPVLEDACESHGAEVNGGKVGSFGTLSTVSFFVAHNMTTGEGGMIFTNDEKLDSIAKSLREFGRISTEERFPYVNDSLKRYDKRYVFTRIGYNVRMADPIAGFGIEQLKKLDSFNEKRRENAAYYTEHLKKYEHLIQLPKEKPGTKHTFYGYVISIKDKNIKRDEFVKFLEGRKIETRPFLAGSLPDQPAFMNQPKRVVGDLRVSKWLRDNAFFVGCHPLMDKQRLDYVIESIKEFLEGKE